METATEDFLTSFHQITGSTIGERRKNLFILLNRTKQSDFKDIDFDAIEPKTSLEHSFKVQILLHFNKIPSLIEVLKSENSILIEKLMKEKFLLQLFEYTTETQLIEDYFPHFSFNTKVKIINKLAIYVNDEKRADALFAAIEKKYGYYLATKLLPCCSSDLILECSKSLKFELTPRQLLLIVKKHPNLTSDIIKNISQYAEKNAFGVKYKLVFDHLLKTDFQLFLSSQKEFDSHARAGWRATNKIITQNKTIVTDQATVFYKYLHCKQISKCYTNDFSKFYKNMLPLSLSFFKKNITYYVDLLKHLPKNVSKINIFLDAFNKVYSNDLIDSGCVHQNILELMSIDQRESWMNSHTKPDYISDVIWICLMKTDKSIPALKKLISLKYDIKERAELIGCLIETCRINDDNEGLLNVLKYMWGQHRNDHNTVLMSFLSTLKNCFKFQDLSEAHWKYILDLINHWIARNGVMYHQNEWLYAYINYLICNNLPVKDTFLLLIKKVNGGMCSMHSNIEGVQAQKTFLEILGEFLPSLCESSELKTYSVQYLQDVLFWNQHHPNHKLSLLPYESPINFFKESHREENCYQYIGTHVLLEILKSDLSDQNKEEILDCVLKKSQIHMDVNLPLWFIKHRPLIIDKYLDEVTKVLLNMQPRLSCIYFWKLCCNYTHLNIPQRMMYICLGLLQSEEENACDKKNVIIALSCLMSPSEFIKFITPYYPNDLQMDVNSDDQDLYNFQQGIMISLKNVLPPSMTFDSILHFSKGDYMKFIQRTIHSVSHNAAENKLSAFFPSFNDHPVSVRKYAIYQTLKVLDKTAIFSMLNYFKQTERNSSILKIVFRGTFNYFTKNPSNELFDLVKENLKVVDVNDEEAFAVLLNINKIPTKHLPEYLTYSYDIFDKLPADNEKVQEGKIKLLSSITPEIMKSIPEVFSFNIVAKLFKNLDCFGDAVQNFTCKFLAYSDRDNVCKIFDVVKDFVTSSWSNDKTRSASRKQVNAFIRTLCFVFVNDKNAPKDRLKHFISLWNNFIKFYEAFNEYLIMYFSELFLDSKPLIEGIFHLCDLVNEYDCVVIFDIANVLSEFLPYFWVSTDDVFEINRLDLIGKLINSCRRNCILLGVSLLPDLLPNEDLLQSLREVKDPIISLYCSSYLQKISLEKNKVVKEVKEYISGRYQFLYYVSTFTNKYRQ